MDERDESKGCNNIELTEVVENSDLNVSSHSKVDAIQNQDTKNFQTPSKYKPYIDGLRTIAIVTVVIYHAFPDFIPGGFIGVDVFFVISGYLISQIIIKEVKKNRFSYANFYSRRVKRIYPALLLVLGFVLYVVSKFYDFKNLDFTLKTLGASTIFCANIQILTHEKGYFDPEIHVNPLLHLWSLGVEEQFYILWPFLISFGLNAFKKHTFLVFAFYTAFSFIFGIFSVYNNPKFAFYFPVCRFWQMSVGGIVAYFSLKIKNYKINNALSIIGTLSILITVWIINQQSLFPGFWALIPTLASACIIQAGSEPFINKYILSSKIFTFVGKISYPMYLWHWPLLVLSRYFYPEGSTSILSNLYFVILITVILSILTYYLVENPIRKIKTKKIAIVLFLLILTVGLLSYSELVKAREREELIRLHSDINYILAEAEKEMIPRPEDYIEKNGKMIPNLSKSKNRKYPTVEKIKISLKDLEKDFLSEEKELILEKKVVEGSKYYVKDRPFLNIFQTANEGKENQVFLIGDSHALRLGYRFQQLYRDSVSQNKTDSFPTVVAMIKTGSPLIDGNYLLNFSLTMIKEHKPKRVLLLCHWLVYQCAIYENFEKEPQCKFEQFKRELEGYINYIKEIQKEGVDISVISLNFHHINFNPSHMFDLQGIIDKNIQPIKQSEFRNHFKQMFDYYETKIRDLNVDLIDLADNLCYEDICEVTSPEGYSIYTDPHHFSKFYSRHWLSVVDHVVEF